MRLSTKAQYAVRALVSLHLYDDGAPVSIKEISKREDISLNYLEQLFVKMRRGDIVRSIRGPGGGYVLARPASEIQVDQIIDTVEESLVPVACMDDKGSCNCGGVCTTHNVWQGLAEKIRDFLASITLEDLTRDAREQGLSEGLINTSGGFSKAP